MNTEGSAKPLDDPRLQELFSAAIDGALTSGYQGVAKAPAGHWLEYWWQKGADVAAAEARARDQARSATTEGRGPKDAEPGAACGTRPETPAAQEGVPAEVLTRYRPMFATGRTGMLYPDPEGQWVRFADVRAALAAARAEPAGGRDEREALRELVAVIDAAGLSNLSEGVQIGRIAWLVKAGDCMDAARASLAPPPSQQTKDSGVPASPSGSTSLRSSDPSRDVQQPEP